LRAADAQVPTIAGVDEAAADVLVHVHVPKCAGTAVRAWLFRAVFTGFGVWYPDYVFDDERLESVGLRDVRVRAFSSHSIRRFPTAACGRRMNYFTLLRRPVPYVLSRLRYHYQLQVLANRRPPFGNGEFSSREAVSWLMDDARAGLLHDVMQTNFFALYPWCDSEGKSRRCDPNAFTSWPAGDRAAYQRQSLDIARDVLRRFLMVGIVERVVDSLDVLAERAADRGFRLLPSQELTLENVTSVRLDNTDWITEEDPVGRRFLESLAEDEALYRFAESLLNEAAGKARGQTR
jgi:hypothetical protein